jgi:hypothetical integral membrane protein (TIGR02206 family)
MPFTIFGLSHIVVIVITLFFSWLTFFQFRLKDQTKVQINLFLAILLGLQIIVFNSWHIFYQDFDLTRFLPFHLCTISAYISVLALILNKDWLYKLQFFWSPVAAAIALLLPEMGADENFPNFRFIEFFWSHSLIVIIAFWIIFSGKLKIKYIDVWTYFGSLVAFAFGVIFWINKKLSANYMYLMNKPNGGQMDFLPSEPYHVFGLLGIFLLVFHLQFFIWKFCNKTK